MSRDEIGIISMRAASLYLEGDLVPPSSRVSRGLFPQLPHTGEPIECGHPFHLPV